MELNLKEMVFIYSLLILLLISSFFFFLLSVQSNDYNTVMSHLYLFLRSRFELVITEHHLFEYFESPSNIQKKLHCLLHTPSLPFHLISDSGNYFKEETAIILIFSALFKLFVLNKPLLSTCLLIFFK